MVWWLAGLAIAGPCADLEGEVDAAWAAYDDAEIAHAIDHMDLAYSARACQPSPVDLDTLLRLYRLDALVALSRKDRSGGVDAVIRGVAAAPDDAPPDTLGPELADLHDAWRARLVGARALVEQVGGGHVWVDGRLVPGEGRLTVIGGEHVVQHEADAGLVGAVVDVQGTHRVETGLPGGPVLAPLRPPKPPEPPPATRSGGPRAALLGIGLVSAGLGGATVGWGLVQERMFHDNPFRPEAFGDCAAGAACYEREREAAIRDSARRINLVYTAGYALLGTGVLLGTVGIVLGPGPDGGVQVSVGGRL